MATKSYMVNVAVVGDASSATKTLDQVGSKAEAAASKSSGAFKAMGGLIRSAAGDAFGPFQEGLVAVTAGIDHVKENGKSVASMMTGIGVGMAGLGILGQQIGSKDREAQAQLKQAIENTGNSWDDYKDKVESSIKSQEKYGHTANETQNALQTLTQSTKDPAKALQYLSTASDLAAAKHESLTQAATMLSTVLAGKGARALAQFGIAQQQMAVTGVTLTAATKAAATADGAAAKAKDNLAMLEDRLHAKKKLTLADQQAEEKAQQAVVDADDKASAAHQKLTADQDAMAHSGLQGAAAVDQLSQKLKGQAAAAANSFSGQLRAVKAEIEDGAAKLGQKYGPALTGVGTGITAVSGLMGLFKKGQEAAAAGTTLLTTATEGETVAMDASAVSEGLALAPILLIIAALVLLGVGIYELVTHWKVVWQAIQDAVHSAVTFVSGLISSVVDFIGQHWQLLLAILTGPVGLAVLFIKDHFNDIVNFISGIPGRIASFASHMFDSLLTSAENIGSSILSFFEGLPGRIMGALAGLGGSIMGMVTSPLKSIPVIGGLFKAGGGPVAAGSPYIVGEKGPEWFVPSSAGTIIPNGAWANTSQFAPVLSAQTAMLQAGGGTAGAGSYSGVGGAPSGDLVMEMNGREYARVSGPDLQAWLISAAGRNGRNGTLTGVRG